MRYVPTTFGERCGVGSGAGGAAGAGGGRPLLAECGGAGGDGAVAHLHLATVARSAPGKAFILSFHQLFHL